MFFIETTWFLNLSLKCSGRNKDVSFQKVMLAYTLTVSLSNQGVPYIEILLPKKLNLAFFLAYLLNLLYINSNCGWQNMLVLLTLCDCVFCPSSGKITYIKHLLSNLFYQIKIPLSFCVSHNPSGQWRLLLPHFEIEESPNMRGSILILRLIKKFWYDLLKCFVSLCENSLHIPLR